jgi:hypothetical protein
MKIFKTLLILLLIKLSIGQTRAQEVTTQRPDTINAAESSPFDFDVQLRNQYLWRGFRVSDNPIIDADLHYYLTKDKALAIGFWGGTDFAGKYKEFNYYISYTKPHFDLYIWDANNISNNPHADIFNYNRTSTTHAVDVRATYHVGSSFPLSINWDTFIIGKDIHVATDGTVSNNYSNYVELDYRISKTSTTQAHLFVGGGFAFQRKENFYGSKPNIVNTGITLNKTLEIYHYHIPVAATAMFNPEQKYGAIQIVVDVI